MSRLLRLRPKLAFACSPGCIAALVVAALVAVLWMSTWQRVRFESGQAIADASAANANLAIGYEESVDNALGDVDQLLRLAEIEYRDQGWAASGTIAQWQLDRELVRGIAVSNADGATVLAAGEARFLGPAIAEISRQHGLSGEAGLQVGRPRTLDIDGTAEVRLFISRRMSQPDGSYAGTAVALVNPAFFTRFFRHVDPDAVAVVTLVALDGTAIARRVLGSATFDVDMRSSTLFSRLPAQPSGSFTSRGVLEGVPRLMSYRTMAHYPLVVMVGSSLDATLAPVRERARLYYGLAVAASALIAMVALGLLGAVRRHREDFEALRRTEAILRQTAARKEAITEHMAGGVVIAALDGTILSVNRSGAAMFGYSSAEMIGTRVRRLVAEPDRARVDDLLAQAQANPASRDHGVQEFRGLRKDGTTFEVEALGSIVTFDGQANVVSIVHDITERKGLERAVRRSEALYRATFDQAMLGIVHTGLDGRFIRANRQACEMLGYGEQEMLSRGYRDVTHPEDLVESARRHEELLADPARHFEFQVTRRYLRKDGSILWGLASVGVIRGEDGMPEFFLTMVQDVTELKRVDEMKNEFISTVSHELRSPLTSIRGSLGLLAGGVAGELPKAAHDLAVIGERNCERLIRLVNDLLDTQRMESGRMRFELRPTDVRALATRAVESMQGYAIGRNVKLRLQLPVRAMGANVDPDRFIQAATNLISNAVKFSPAGMAVEVAVERTPSGRVRLEVRDHGPGVPTEFEGRIFERFSQADSSSTRAQGGTGLGLYITKGIVERLGGTIGFASKAGEGAAFYIELAAAELPATEREQELSA